MATPHNNAERGDIAKTILLPGDLVIAMGACSDTNYANQYGLPGNYAATASFDLLREAVAEAETREINFAVGNVLSTDVFYRKPGATKP